MDFESILKRVNLNVAELCMLVREKLRLSQETIARMIESTQTEISFIERGFVPRKRHKVEALVRIALEHKVIKL